MISTNENILLFNVSTYTIELILNVISYKNIFWRTLKLIDSNHIFVIIDSK